ncbi:Crp/Fnr family transcriptional regulator [Treponema socranskii]|uniref:Cyclic nucleotide-binding domain protein n=1 Tax=Treponema socranskii subsp. socranskii VPI DR56BR1116 = ATCC 35536 TaxID=1125725 RepID=U2MTQ5_TRESO|nr:cyclic nucleotide-binding domain-containing protein [Treponema socranskii]ERF61524.1 cyclic nucleotide-binding domain protein [Treponema socranskii subsp. socranskii VPI DR56BR1116 = ATCC 35536]ERK02619.1 cyclic nucleotide-binding domain protein [Treponema socranskii subsp. socranskii VPI DR56BR1116 = ATCC 35536]MDR9858126.1 cyclic nucleotide-binding domain-containing protein [Treponema socranskii]
MLQLSFVNFRKGSYLVVEGKAESDRFFIIQSGNVRCFKATDAPGGPIKLLGPGDFVGVIPCMSGHSQIETVIAITDVTGISVRRDQYPELIMRNTPVAMKIIRTFANGMRSMNETLTKLTLNNVVADTPEHIFDVADYYDKAGFSDIAVYAYYQYLKACPRGLNAGRAKERFIVLKERTHAVYFESTPDLMRVYPKSTMIFSESQNGPDMFIIQEGQVKISKVVDGNEVTLAMLKKGDMFGEMALLENKPRSASAIAHEPCKLMAVNRQNFDLMVATQPQLISRLTTMLADRLWSMYRQIDNANLHDPLHKLIDILALQVEKTKINLSQQNVQYQTDLTPYDLANMCGLPKEQQAESLIRLQSDSHVRFINGKILVPDCRELVKQAAFYRKQNNNA